MGAMFACFQSSGTHPCWRVWLKIKVSMEAISTASSFRRRLGMSSGPDTLLVTILFRSLATPGSVTSSGFISFEFSSYLDNR